MRPAVCKLRAPRPVELPGPASTLPARRPALRLVGGAQPRPAPSEGIKAGVAASPRVQPDQAKAP